MPEGLLELLLVSAAFLVAQHAVSRAIAYLEAREARQAAAEAWPTFEPTSDLERWLLQRDGGTLGEFLERVERDREAADRRRAANQAAAVAAGHHDVAFDLGARWHATGAVELYCRTCEAWIDAAGALEHGRAPTRERFFQ